ncbi:MAG: 3-oxoacyl-ACP reductase FabG [Bacteroidetes bacterium]|nr:3-oxoacyl-ACP reductase FabG [Bacteroidota bacterium]
MKVALVTGGSRGIGRAICVKLAELGYFVLINYQSNKAAAEETLAEVKSKGSDGELMMFDVADEAQVQSVLGTWLENHKENPVEILVNNAGIKNDTLLMWMSTKQWKDVLNTSMDGFFNVTKLVVQGMLVKKYGRIVNVVSLSGLKGMPGQANYSAAKAGVIGATKALAQEVGRRNITVNAVAPGFIRTDMTKDIDEKSFKQLIPVARFGNPEEVAEAVCFLASEKASYITGVVLNVNGGLYT